MAGLTGGCLCGQVRYTVTADPVMTAICHCTSCQRQGGTAYSVVLGIPAGSLAVEGTLKTYSHPGGSGEAVHRRFCPNCGSPIVTEGAAGHGLSFLKAGTLDDTSGLKPTVEVCCAEAQPWVAPGTETHRFAGMPGPG